MNRTEGEPADAQENKCTKCGTTFRDAYNLRRHQARKKTCEPIINQPAGVCVDDEHACRYCGRTFTTATSMYRHVRTRCKIANSQEGMEKLLDHTLQRQLAEQGAQLTEQSAQITKLTALVERLATTGQQIAAPQGPPPIHYAGQVNYAGQVSNTTIVNIHPWDGERRIGIDIAHIVAAFADNAKLREYSRLGAHELTDPDIAPPYVMELLMDLTKRAHADPSARNVYLNPQRADQVLVHKTNGRWEVLPLAVATRLVFDGVAETIHRVAMTDAERRQLPLDAQNALAMAGMLYEDEPDEYTTRARTPMSAHLSNTHPSGRI